MNAERVSQRQRNEIRHFGLVPVRAKAFEFSHVRSWAMLVTLLARALASATHNLDQREAVHLVRRHTSTWWCTGTDHKASAQPRARVVLYIITTKPKYLDETSQTAAFLASRVGHGWNLPTFRAKYNEHSQAPSYRLFLRPPHDIVATSSLPLAQPSNLGCPSLCDHSERERNLCNYSRWRKDRVRGGLARI